MKQGVAMEIRNSLKALYITKYYRYDDDDAIK